MSKLIYSKEIEKREEIVSKPLEHNRVLAITIITVLSISLLIAVSFVYMGYSPGLYSQSYVLCKDDVLGDVRTGIYQSVGEITSALKTCYGAKLAQVVFNLLFNFLATDLFLSLAILSTHIFNQYL